MIDEVSLWERSLSAQEIKQLYRRGANRLKLQVRSCDDSACSGEDWQGLDGSASSFFSELFNKSGYDTLTDQNSDTLIDYTDYILGGILKLTSPSFTFSDFSNAGLDISNNRYFQYRVIMESEDENNLCDGAPCMPDLQSISLSSTTKYYGATQTITTSNPIVYSGIVSIDITADACVEFQLSNNGTNYYFWSGSSWTAVTGDSDRNVASLVEANISDFTSDVGSGNLHIKSFLTSNTATTCEVSDITVEKW